MAEAKKQAKKQKIIKRIRTKRRLKTQIEDLALPDNDKIDLLARKLVQQINSEIFKRKHARTADILKLVGAGAFLAASIAVPTLPLILKPFLTESKDKEVWKRFNLPYLKRVLDRLEKQKLVKIVEQDNLQVVKITRRGRMRILRFSLDEIEITKPKRWDSTWRLVSYDFPKNIGNIRNTFRRYLSKWGFYPFHESVFLHAYPCLNEVEFLREYLGISEYVRILKASKIENDKLFREYFGV